MSPSQLESKSIFLFVLEGTARYIIKSQMSKQSPIVSQVEIWKNSYFYGDERCYRNNQDRYNPDC